jgi:hypothetical protein
LTLAQDVEKKKAEPGTPQCPLKNELIALMGSFYWPSEKILLVSTKAFV